MKNAIRKVSASIIAVLVSIILIWSFPLPCLAQSNSKPQTRLNDLQELEGFLDKFFAQQMPKEHIPGAVFTLVKDGKIFFSKGYGYADLAKKTPVIPEQTLFRVGSISKLFTATAVMQLAEQNKLKLDDDVNKYLKHFQIENTYKKPITFAHLLTHTDGFDSGWGIGAFARSASQMTPLGDFIAKRLPPRIMPPGEVFLYSDVGMNLAGYLVEEIAGIPFAQYIEKNILQPLNMRRSSFFQPLPPQLASDLAVGYKYKNGTYQQRPFVFSNTIAGNALMATATDIGHFAIAHLQNGSYGNAKILNNATAIEMHRQHFAHYPGMKGATYGFYQKTINQQKAIIHNGRHAGYTTTLYLLPEQNLGFFVACNNNPSSLPDELVKQFFNHYYPIDKKIEPIPQRLASSQADLQKLGGAYRYNRYPHHTMEKLAAVFGEAPEILVTPGNDGTLSLYAPEYKSVEIKPLLFRFFYSNDLMTFRQDKGSITHLFVSDSVFAALEKLAWYETNIFQLTLLLFCTITFISVCIVGLIRSIRKRAAKNSKIAQWAQFLAVLVSTLNLVFLIGMVLVLSQADFWELFLGLPWTLMALLLIPPLTTGLSLGLLIFTVLVWKNHYWSLRGRSYYTLITIAAFGFISFLNYWNLLGFQL